MGRSASGRGWAGANAERGVLVHPALWHPTVTDSRASAAVGSRRAYRPPSTPIRRAEGITKPPPGPRTRRGYCYVLQELGLSPGAESSLLKIADPVLLLITAELHEAVAGATNTRGGLRAVGSWDVRMKPRSGCSPARSSPGQATRGLDMLAFAIACSGPAACLPRNGTSPIGREAKAVLWAVPTRALHPGPARPAACGVESPPWWPWACCPWPSPSARRS